MIAENEAAEVDIVEDIVRRRRTREKANEMIKKWLSSKQGQSRPKKHVAEDNLDNESLATEELPTVFNRSTSAKQVLNSLRNTGDLAQTQLREISLLHLTAQQASEEIKPIVDEDTLSLESFSVDKGKAGMIPYDRKKRTILERMFATDRDVRKGRLRKNLKQAVIDASANFQKLEEGKGQSNAPRALVIEGAALKHLLGNPELEQILFSVASKCDAIIACRVSPKQKALLVNLVINNVKPKPISLAIGDGANDVGMIQEAQVGVGISGKEGKQAVNASDFAIAQFRFLEELILIHGRWNFLRLSTVVLFSFYKNAIMAGTLIIFSYQNLFSGTPLFNQWCIAVLNFIAGVPIVFTGLFDRYLSKHYVRENPSVYKPTRENEVITKRTVLRWLLLSLVDVFMLYYFTVPQQRLGGGITSSFQGLMAARPRDMPGNGEGNDLTSVGLVTFTCMVTLLAYKVSCLFLRLARRNFLVSL